jgi:hypothetical protein
MPPKKPIAVIADTLTNAIDILSELHDLREVNGPKRVVTAKNGQRFVIILFVQDSYGYEFSDILCIPTAWKNVDYERIYSIVKTRVR